MSRRQRFDAKYIVDADTGCWVWQWAISNRGYGVYEGQSAHRVWYERAHGPIPKGLDLDHLCRNPPCVNPDHLEPVTRAENIRRANKLSADDVIAIRRDPRAASVVARERGVTSAHIGRLRSGQSAPDLPMADVEYEDGRVQTWTPEEVLAAILRFHERYGRAPSAADFNPSQARSTGNAWRAERFYADGDYPLVPTVQLRFGSWSAAIRKAGLTPARTGAQGTRDLAEAA